MKHQNRHNKSIFIAGGIGASLSVAISAGLLLVMTTLINASKMNIDIAGIGTVVAQGISVLMGAIIAGKVADNQKAIACGICTGGYVLFLIILSMLFMNGVGKNVFVGLAAAAVGCIGGIVLNIGKLSRHKTIRRRRFR